MPEVAEERGSPVSASQQSKGANGPPAADVERTTASGVALGVSHSHRTALLDAVVDVPIAALQTLALSFRRYGAELLAFVAAVAVCRYLVGMPALALGAMAGIATYLVRVLILRIRQ